MLCIERQVHVQIQFNEYRFTDYPLARHQYTNIHYQTKGINLSF